MNECSEIYKYRRIVRAKLFMDNHFNEQINLENISGEAYFSKFHFIKLFKTIYNLTPYQYLMSVRLEQAMILLKKAVIASDVCYAVGFKSIPSFSNLFKKWTGTSPAVYQQQQKKLKHAMTNSPLNFIPNCFISNHDLVKKSNFQ
ncbi:MAG: AraC family transcriptional regulator [Ferruginibacter sp.]